MGEQEGRVLGERRAGQCRKKGVVASIVDDALGQQVTHIHIHTYTNTNTPYAWTIKPSSVTRKDTLRGKEKDKRKSSALFFGLGGL
jgi:hypothetical protein